MSEDMSEETSEEMSDRTSLLKVSIELQAPRRLKIDAAAAILA